MWIRVGLDQWIVVNGVTRDGHGLPERVGLNTNGLSGCVAIGMRWGNMLSLAHVYSGCDVGTWTPAHGGGYLATLDSAFEGSRRVSGMVEGRDIEAVLYYSEGTQKWLPNQLYEWLLTKGVDAPEESAASCRFWIENGRLCWNEKLAESPAQVNNFTTSDNAAAPILFYQALSASAAAASPPQGDDD